MADARSSGVFGDSRSGDGLFRGFYAVNSGTANTKVPGAPIDILARREVIPYFADFLKTSDIDDWVLNTITSGTAGILTGTDGDEFRGGVVQLRATTDNQGIESYQIDDATNDNAADFITPGSGRSIMFEARARISDVDQPDWFIGIAETDAAFMGSDGTLGAPGSDNHVGFHHLAGTGVVNMSSNGAGGTTEQTALGSGVSAVGGTVSQSLTDDTFHQFGIRIEGTSQVEFYVDDRLVHTRTMASALAETMTPTFCLIADGTARDLEIDYVLVVQTR